MAIRDDGPGRTGAVREGGKRKKGGLFALLGLLALLRLYLLLRGGSDDKKKAAVVPLVSTEAPPTTSAAPLPSTEATPLLTTEPAPSAVATSAPAGAPTAVPTDSAAGAAAGASAGPAGSLVGGSGVAAAPASGRFAVAGGLATVLFAEDRAAMDAEAQRVIAQAAATIKATSPAHVSITGYTDKIAGQPTNVPLSQRRADAVEHALQAAVGTSTTNYSAGAKGESDPIGDNSTAQGRQDNRRATITTS